MHIVLNMPYSTIHLNGQDSPKAIGKIRDFLTFKAKVYNPTIRKTEKYAICLLEEGSDGLIRFRTGLFDRIQKVANVSGLQITTDDRRCIPTHNAELMGVDVQLRDYQDIAVTKLLNYDMGILYAATGSGKTHMAAAIIGRRALSTLFLVHTRELLYQAKERLEELLGIKIGVIGDGHYDPKTVTIATFQTLNRMQEERANLPQFDMIVIDEVHHLPAETFFTVSASFSCRYVYGLSATPDRKDGTDMMIEAGAGPIAAQVSPSNLIRADQLVRPEICFISIKERTMYYPMMHHVLLKKFIEAYVPRNELIAEITRERVQEGDSVLIAVRHVNHAKILHKLLPEAEVMIGEDDSTERRKTLEDFRQKKISVVISTLLSEGVDIPTLNTVINAAGGKDIRQLVGRALRKSPGKTIARIYDFIDNQHVILQKNSKTRAAKLEEEEEFRVIYV